MAFHAFLDLFKIVFLHDLVDDHVHIELDPLAKLERKLIARSRDGNEQNQEHGNSSRRSYGHVFAHIPLIWYGAIWALQ